MSSAEETTAPPAPETAGGGREPLALLAAAARELAAAAGEEAALTAVAAMALPVLDAWCMVDLVDHEPDAPHPPSVRRLAVLHPDPRRRAATLALHECHPPREDDLLGAPRVLHTARAEHAASVPDAALAALAQDDDHLALLRELGVHSYIIAPMVARGRVTGAFTFVAADPGRRFTETDVLLAGELARRAADALDAARLRREVALARAEAELARHAAAARALRLQALSAALSQASTPEEVACAVVSYASVVFDAVGMVIARITPDGAHLQIMSIDAVNETTREQWREFPLSAPTPMSDVARTGEPLFLESRDEWGERYPHLLPLVDETGHQANAVLPLVVEGRVLGVLGAAFERARTFADDDRALALAVAQQCAQALERARLLQAERAARTEAEAANRSKGEFLAAMSHELRTPLNAIGGYAQLLEMGVQGPVTEEQRAVLRKVELAQRHLLRLVNDVLNYERLQAGRLSYRIGAVNVARVVAEVEPLIRPQLQDKGLSYDTAVPGDILVRADEEKLAQVLLNLLSNAVKFTPPGGMLRVELAQRSDGTMPPGVVFVRVSDTGVGIPADKLDAVFEPFVQVETTLAGRTGGAGLGLAISRDLTRGMGGEIRVRSTLGQGTSFTLALPRAS